MGSVRTRFFPLGLSAHSLHGCPISHVSRRGFATVETCPHRANRLLCLQIPAATATADGIPATAATEGICR